MKKVTSSELQEIVKNAKSKADICRSLDLKPKGANYFKIDRLLEKNNIIWDKPYVPWNKGICYRFKQYSLEEILVENSPLKNINNLRKRLINNGIKNNTCEVCGISGNEVSLELHHINGISTDNRIENLQILCPNCHSKTPNYRGKNINNYIKHNIPEKLILSEEEIIQRDLERKAKKCNKTVEQYLLDKENKQIKKEKTCSVCGKVFNPSDSAQKYCSQECCRIDNKGNRPPLLQLIQDFKELKSFVQVGVKYNVSDNAVGKWCRLYGIPDKANEIKTFINDYK